MAVLSWGKPLLEVGDTGATPTFTELLGKIVDGTAQLTTNKGSKKEALESGGDVVDVRYNKNSYTFTVEFYAIGTKPIEDTDGLVEGNKALRLTPEDDTLVGFLMDKTVVTVEDTFSDADGKKWKYTFDGLKPTTGNILKPYTKAVG